MDAAGITRAIDTGLAYASCRPFAPAAEFYAGDGAGADAEGAAGAGEGGEEAEIAPLHEPPCGLTPRYASPEALLLWHGGLDWPAERLGPLSDHLESYELRPGVDVWAAGVVLYVMVHGILPFGYAFAGRDGEETLMDDVLGLGEPLWMHPWLPAQLRDVLEWMLTRHPDERATAVDVFKHSWCRQAARSLHDPAFHQEWMQDPLHFATAEPAATAAGQEEAAKDTGATDIQAPAANDVIVAIG